jgi:hypothetical protein
MRIEIYGKGNLNFVEFNTTGDNEEYNPCDDESLYLDTEVFNLFTPCFEKSEKMFDYFGPTRYNSRNIIPLLNELKVLQTKLKEITSFDFFIDFIGSSFLGTNFIYEIEKLDKNWHLNWEQYCQKLIMISNQLISLVIKCIDQSRTLWVIGY